MVKTCNFEENVITLEIEHKVFDAYIDPSGKYRNIIRKQEEVEVRLESVFIDYKVIHEVGLKEAYSKVFERGTDPFMI